MAGRSARRKKRPSGRRTREAQGKWWFVNVGFWCLVGAAGLFGVLGYLWHPLWVVATVLFAALGAIWVLGWLGVLGWFALDATGFEVRRKRD